MEYPLGTYTIFSRMTPNQVRYTQQMTNAPAGQMPAQAALSRNELIAPELSLPVEPAHKMGCGCLALIVIAVCGAIFYYSDSTTYKTVCGILIALTLLGAIAYMFVTTKCTVCKAGIYLGNKDFIPWSRIKSIKFGEGEKASDIPVFAEEETLDITITYLTPKVADSTDNATPQGAVQYEDATDSFTLMTETLYQQICVSKFIWMYHRYCPAYHALHSALPDLRQDSRTRISPVFNAQDYIPGPFPKNGCGQYYKRDVMWDCIFCGLWGFHRQLVGHKNGVFCGWPHYLLWIIFAGCSWTVFLTPLSSLWFIICAVLWIRDMVQISKGTYKDGDGFLLIPGSSPKYSSYETYYDLCIIWAEFGIHRIYIGKKGSGYFMLVVSLLATADILLQKACTAVLKFLLKFSDLGDRAKEIISDLGGRLLGLSLGYFCLVFIFSFIVGQTLAPVLAMGAMLTYIVVLIMALIDRIYGFFNLPITNGYGTRVQTNALTLFRERAQDEPQFYGYDISHYEEAMWTRAAKAMQESKKQPVIADEDVLQPPPVSGAPAMQTAMPAAAIPPPMPGQAPMSAAYTPAAPMPAAPVAPLPQPMGQVPSPAGIGAQIGGGQRTGYAPMTPATAATPRTVPGAMATAATPRTVPGTMAPAQIPSTPIALASEPVKERGKTAWIILVTAVALTLCAGIGCVLWKVYKQAPDDTEQISASEATPEQAEAQKRKEQRERRLQKEQLLREQLRASAKAAEASRLAEERRRAEEEKAKLEEERQCAEEQARQAREAQTRAERERQRLEEEVRERTKQEEKRRQSPAYTQDEDSEPPSGSISNTRRELDSFISGLQGMYTTDDTISLYRKRLLTLLPLIRNGEKVDITLKETKGNTALHYACGIGDYDLVECLLRLGANPNAVTDKGATPMKCAGGRNVDAIRALLRRYGAQ